MDFKRAQEIVSSPDTYEVLYKGKQVWITGLHPGESTADIEILDGKVRATVPVKELEEGGKLNA